MSSAAKKARSLDARSGTAPRLSEKRSGRRSPRKQIAIFGTCSMVNCTGAPIAAMKIEDFWVSQCLLHSKGRGKIDMDKITRPEARATDGLKFYFKREK